MKQVSPAIQKILDRAAQDLTFTPSPEQRRARSNFWTAPEVEGASQYRDTRDLAIALRFGRDRRIPEWWDTPGFQDWFYNQDEFRQRMEYLAGLCLDQLEGLVTSPATKPADKVAAIKLVMQLSNRMANQAQEEYLDEKVAKMTRTQLEEFISKNAPRLNSVSEDLTSEKKSDTIDVTE